MKYRYRLASRLMLAVWLVGQVAPPSFAEGVPQDELLQLSLEELMNVRVTSAQRKDQSAENVAAPVYVITQDDIRRSGLTEVPEILRLVPGVQVAQVNGSQWALSIRGFNGVYSDKLLVLIDGRSLYNRGFSGTFWDSQNILASDIERIEVIRGPGGTAWGANAVNGVINIITKSAADTRGTVVQAATGTHDRNAASARHGGSVGNTDYRVYSNWMNHGSGVTDAGSPADDHWRAVTTGARADWSRGAESVMVQGSYMSGESRPLWVTSSLFAPRSIGGISDLTEAVGLVKWTHRQRKGALFQAQGSRAVTTRDESTLYTKESTTDIDLQYQMTAGDRHTIVTGGGYRLSAFASRGTPAVDLPGEESHVTNAFVQDDIAVTRAVEVSLGGKVERDTFAGVGFFPTMRVMWNLGDSAGRVWATVSRARRNPGAVYRSLRLLTEVVPGEDGVPLAIEVHGNPAYKPEDLTQVDLGYRLHIGSTASVDVAAFRGWYDNSTTFEAREPHFEFSPVPHVLVPMQYDNLLEVRTQGLEISGRWSPASKWRIDGSYSTVHVTPRLDAMSTDVSAQQFDGDAPQHQWQVHSSMVLNPRLQAKVGLFHVGRLRQLAVPAYTRADARVELKLTNQLTAAVIGQNLTRASHVEFSGVNQGLTSTTVPRTARVQLQWQF